MKKEKTIEIARSFSWTLQIEPFSPRNFFCSLKAEVPEDEMTQKSKELYDLCRAEVEKSVAEYQSKPEQPLTPQESEIAGELAREESFKENEEFEKQAKDSFEFQKNLKDGFYDTK